MTLQLSGGCTCIPIGCQCYAPDANWLMLEGVSACWLVDWLSWELRQQMQNQRVNMMQTREAAGELRRRWRRRVSSGDPWTPADWRHLSGWGLQTPAGGGGVTTCFVSTWKCLKVKGGRLTWPQAYMLLWVWEGFTLESRKRAWKTSSSSTLCTCTQSVCFHCVLVLSESHVLILDALLKYLKV